MDLKNKRKVKKKKKKIKKKKKKNTHTHTHHLKVDDFSGLPWMRIHKFSRDTPDIVYLVVYSYIIKVITFDLGHLVPRLEDLFGHGNYNPHT